MSIFFPKRRRPSSHGSLIRTLGFVLIFLLAGWAFWQNNERNIGRIKARQAISDMTNTLSDDDIAHLRAFAAVLEERYGLAFRLQVTADVLKVPDVGPRTLYMGLNPQTRLVVMEFPTLAASALGQDFTRYLRDAHFEQYWDGPGWPEGLRSAQILILERLEAADGKG